MLERPRVLLLSPDAHLARELGDLARSASAEFQASPQEQAPLPTGPWAAILVDGRTRTPATLEWARTRHGATAWISSAPRGETTAQALAQGIDAVLTLPLWAPEARGTLDRLLEIASLRRSRDAQHDLVGNSEVQIQACAAQLDESRQHQEKLYGELEAHARDLQTLISVQQALIPMQTPRELEGRIAAALGSLFPGSRIVAHVWAAGSENCAGQRAVEGDDLGWSRATVPLEAAGLALGQLEVAAPEGQTHPRRRLDLLEVYAREAAQALHRSRLHRDLSLGKAEWERTFDTIRDCISLVGPDLVLRRANRALAEAVGKAPGDLVGQPCFRALYGRDQPCPVCPVQEALATGEQARARGEVVRGKRAYDYRAYPLRGDDGTVYGAIAYARDVTREEELVRGLRHSEKLMTLGQIAAGIAHEINNPLTAVSSYAQLLVLRLRDARDAESARRIQEGVDRMHRLVRNLMSFVRPSEESFFPLDLNEIVTDALFFSRYEVSREETRLVEQLGEGMPRVLGSKDQLEHLLVNLLTNARDAVAGRGTVRIITRANATRVFLEVEDDGAGIEPAAVERIFDPFFTTKAPGKGTGLGLFIAAGIARKHGGELAVQSEPGRGSRFTLALPAFAA